MIGPQSRIFVFLLGALMMVNVLSIDMTLPALPALGAALSATPDQIQLTLSLYLLGYAAGQIVIGPLSDRFRTAPRTGQWPCGLFAGDACLRRKSRHRYPHRGASLSGCLRLWRTGHGASDRARPFRGRPRRAHDVVPYYRVRLGAVAGADNRRRAARALWVALRYSCSLPSGHSCCSLPLGRYSRKSLREPDKHALQPARILTNYRTFFTTRAAVGYAGAERAVLARDVRISLGLALRADRNLRRGARPLRLLFRALGPDANTGCVDQQAAIAPDAGRARHALRFPDPAFGGAAAVAIPFSPLNGPFALTAAIMIYVFGQMLVQPNAVAAALMPLRHMAGTGSALMGMMQMLFGALGGYAVNALYDGTPLPMTGTLLVAGLAGGGPFHRTRIVDENLDVRTSRGRGGDVAR